jgi:hypothetical protein
VRLARFPETRFGPPRAADPDVVANRGGEAIEPRVDFGAFGDDVERSVVDDVEVGGREAERDRADRAERRVDDATRERMGRRRLGRFGRAVGG